MENVLKLIGSLVMIILIAMSSLWTTYILWDVSILYGLTYLTQHGYQIFFGTLFIYGILISGLKKKDKQKETLEIIGDWFGSQVGWFLVWGMAYVYHWILKF